MLLQNETKIEPDLRLVPLLFIPYQTGIAFRIGTKVIRYSVKRSLSQ